MRTSGKMIWNKKKRLAGSARKLVLLSVGALLCFASAGYSATLTLTGVGNGFVMGGVYVSPYVGTIDGGPPTYVICDDFATDASLNSPWTANSYTLSQVTTSGPQKFTTPEWGYTIQQDYTAAALLAQQLLLPTNMNNSTLAGEYSFAIWTIFDPNAVNGWNGVNPLSSSQVSAVTALRNTYLADAAAGQTPSGNVTIYTPSPLGASQEFLTVNAPEASTPVLLAVDLLGLAALFGLLRKRKFSLGR